MFRENLPTRAGTRLEEPREATSRFPGLLFQMGIRQSRALCERERCHTDSACGNVPDTVGRRRFWRERTIRKKQAPRETLDARWEEPPHCKGRTGIPACPQVCVARGYRGVCGIPAAFPVECHNPQVPANGACPFATWVSGLWAGVRDVHKCRRSHRSRCERRRSARRTRTSSMPK